MKVLLVEDSPTDSLLAQDALREVGVVDISVAQTVAEASAVLHTKSFEVVLLDLGLPDSQGLDTVRKLFPHCSEETAIVVLTGNDDEAVGASALQLGAQDYLRKAVIQNVEAFRRCLLYAHERCKHITTARSLERALQEARKKEELKQETGFWADLVNNLGMGASADEADSAKNANSSADTFAQLVVQYCEILDHAVEQRVKKVERDASEESIKLVQQLGTMNATARDVIAIHIAALRKRIDASKTLSMAQAYHDESRLRLVEIMGYLAAFYQRNASGINSEQGKG